MSDERAAWVAFAQIEGLGPILLRRIEAHFGSLTAAWEARAADLMAVDGVGLLLAEAIATARPQIDPLALLQQHETENPGFWTPADPEYPPPLQEIPDPPAILYHRGTVVPGELTGSAPLVGIVGTRDPSEYGRRWTRRLTTALVEQGFTIVSGLASGIDTETHRTCLDRGGRTIAVLGTGVNIIYPFRNRQLYKDLIETGLALSEYPAGTKPDRAHFPRRNRIIAGLCRATLVMEAPRRSGALITAQLANDYGREVYILPGSLDNPNSVGCMELLSQGAQVILGEMELLELLGSLPPLLVPPTDPPTPLPEDLDPTARQILQALGELAATQPDGAIPFDRLVQHCELPAGEVSGHLLNLELDGWVTQLPGLQYQLSR